LFVSDFKIVDIFNKIFGNSIPYKMLSINPYSNLECSDFEVVYMSGYPNGIKKRNDFYLPLFTKNLSKVKEFELRKDDYFSNGYPKTGSFLSSAEKKMNLILFLLCQTDL
jgi:hypothetical protein